IESVVGMSGAIGDEAAVSFAAAFYQALAFGEDIKTAFDLGCNEVQLRNLSDHNVPELISRSGSDPAHIYLNRRNAAAVSQISDPPAEGHSEHPGITTITTDSAGSKHRRKPILTAVGLVILVPILMSWLDKPVVSVQQLSQEQPVGTPARTSKTPRQADSSSVAPARISPERPGKATGPLHKYEVTLVLPSMMSKAEILVDTKPAVILERNLTVVKILVEAKDQATEILVHEGANICQQSILINKNRELTPCE
ncbi:MAG: hypothetical protein ACREDR_01935, partial [Blastocatellia bacterium]